MIFHRQHHLEQHHPRSRTKPLSSSSSHSWYPISSTPSTDMWELPSSHTPISGGLSSSSSTSPSPISSMDANDDGHDDAAGLFLSPRLSFLYSESWNGGGDDSNSSFASASAAAAAATAAAARTRSSGVSARTPTNGEFDGDDAVDMHGGVSLASRDDQETTRYFASDASTREILADATNTVPMARISRNNMTLAPSRRIRRSQFY